MKRLFAIESKVLNIVEVDVPANIKGTDLMAIVLQSQKVNPSILHNESIESIKDMEGGLL